MATYSLPYKVQVAIEGKYRPLIQRGRLLHEQPHRSTFPQKRKGGDTNLDLWLDGSIYPADSRGKRPKFTDIRSLLEFVGEGENGLLGYTSNLVKTVLMEVGKSAIELRENEVQFFKQYDSLNLLLQ